MSTPSWLRPAERAAPQVSANARGPAIGQIIPEPAFDDGGSTTGSGSFGASALAAGSGDGAAAAGWGATAAGAAAAGPLAPEPPDDALFDARSRIRDDRLRRGLVGCSLCIGGGSFCIGRGLRGDHGLPGFALPIEFGLDRLVDQPLLLHLGEMDDLSFGRRLQVSETLLGGVGLTLSRLEVGTPGVDLLGDGIEVVEGDRGVAAATLVRSSAVISSLAWSRSINNGNVEVPDSVNARTAWASSSVRIADACASTAASSALASTISTPSWSTSDSASNIFCDASLARSRAAWISRAACAAGLGFG